MNREILFRGKRKDNGEWVEGDLLQNRNLGTYYIGGFENYSNEKGLRRESFVYEVDPETVGQYLDLLGKTFGENDIVEVNRENHRYIGVVKFGKYDTYHYGLDIDWINGSEVLRKELLYWLPKIRVIGNIHDNPELLK